MLRQLVGEAYIFVVHGLILFLAGTLVGGLAVSHRFSEANSQSKRLERLFAIRFPSFKLKNLNPLTAGAAGGAGGGDGGDRPHRIAVPRFFTFSGRASAEVRDSNARHSQPLPMVLPMVDSTSAANQQPLSARSAGSSGVPSPRSGRADEEARGSMHRVDSKGKDIDSVRLSFVTSFPPGRGQHPRPPPPAPSSSTTPLPPPPPDAPPSPPTAATTTTVTFGPGADLAVTDEPPPSPPTPCWLAWSKAVETPLAYLCVLFALDLGLACYLRLSFPELHPDLPLVTPIPQWAIVLASGALSLALVLCWAVYISLSYSNWELWPARFYILAAQVVFVCMGVLLFFAGRATLVNRPCNQPSTPSSPGSVPLSTALLLLHPDLPALPLRLLLSLQATVSPSSPSASSAHAAFCSAPTRDTAGTERA